MRERGLLSDRVHAWLRAEILNVRLLPGAPIAESELAARFATSRTPVREALLRLADEGLVEIRPQRGTAVARLDLPAIAEALFIREAVECAVLREVAAGPDARKVATRLAPVVREQATAAATGDVAAAMAADTRFHRALVEAGPLPGVWETVERVREMHQRVRSLAVPELRSGAEAVREHRAIVAALRTGDAALAVAAMSAHLRRNLLLARALAERFPAWFAGSDGPPAGPADGPTGRGRPGPATSPGRPGRTAAGRRVR